MENVLMTETLKQTAQRLWNKGRIDPDKGLYAFGVNWVWRTPDWIIRQLLSADRSIVPRPLKAHLHEAYAALAVLDGSIVLDSPVDDGWRKVSEHEPPTDDSILACRQASGAQWILNYNTVKRTWMIAGTNQSVVFTHWKPLHQPPKEAQ
jgi:hypothetical protein